MINLNRNVMGISSLSRLFRFTFRSRFLTCINVFGLAFGLAIVMFLLVYLQFEFSYDKHFEDSDRICRVLSVAGKNGERKLPLSIGELAGRLRQGIPEVETVARLKDGRVINFQAEGTEFMGVKIYMADSTFLDIFKFKPVYGQLDKALNLGGNCIITRTTAERFFGPGIDPVGKSLTVFGAGRSWLVTAVIEDIPVNTHFNFEMLIPLDKVGNDWGYYTYLKFRPGVDQKVGMEKCNALNKDLLEERVAPWVEGKYDGITEALADIHISTQADFDLSPTVSRINLIFIVLVALFILGIAISNFTSLFIIQGEQRAVEISVRKTNGADRKCIIKLLFQETFLVTFFAFLIALALFYGCSSHFATFLDFHWPGDIGMNWQMGVEFLVLFLLLGLVVGGYPAYYLSKFNPRELIRHSNERKFRLTAVSVVIQFSVVVFCVSALFVIWRQLDYIKSLPLGFQPENVLEVRVDFPYSYYQGLRAELMQYPFVRGVAAGSKNPLENAGSVPVRRIDQGKEGLVQLNSNPVGPEYFKLYEIPFLEGHDFVNETDTVRSVVLSESAVKSLGVKGDPVGQKIYYFGDKPWTVIGVVNDILESAHQKIEGKIYPLSNYYQYLFVKYLPGHFMKARTAVVDALHKYYEIPFAPVLITDIIQKRYWQDRVTSRILTSGTVLAIVLALLGVLALSAFVAQQKRKEISVRRVLGAKGGEILFNLNRYIIIRILPAIPIGAGLSYYAMSKWIQGFEYAKPLSWWVFALAILVTLGMTLLTVFYQSWKAANENPVNALKGD